LLGDLGTGKTVFVRGIMRGFNYKGAVTSPTYTLVHDYKANQRVYHADCFRLRNRAQVLSAGLEEYFSDNSILIVEWADLIAEYYDQWNWILKFSYSEKSENSRIITFSRHEVSREETLKIIIGDFNTET